MSLFSSSQRGGGDRLEVSEAFGSPERKSLRWPAKVAQPYSPMPPVYSSHGMRNEFALRSRTGVRASFLALTCASSRRAVPHATAHDAVHGAFMTLPPYTRISEDEVHELGLGVRNGSHSARSRPLSKQ